MKNIQPVYIYIFGSMLILIGGSFKDTPAIHYTLSALGFVFVILGIVKYFRDK
ncbi:hypothetical protein [Flavobacterium sp.]|uniref:hypothetical protein n=1 Tax=Flavobacterium sp. TaxID=239 RepID=UPI002486DF94|nr:hypothetical protein [Flavobacterium sp.]MDI1316314.1 hypothetical protein [Flavobacterium sp.]